MEAMRVDTKFQESGPIAADILNPFVHRLELDTTYDKLKVSRQTTNLRPINMYASVSTRVPQNHLM